VDTASGNWEESKTRSRGDAQGEREKRGRGVRGAAVTIPGVVPEEAIAPRPGADADGGDLDGGLAQAHEVAGVGGGGQHRRGRRGVELRGARGGAREGGHHGGPSGSHGAWIAASMEEASEKN
jgi:hypothetical protein